MQDILSRFNTRDVLALGLVASIIALTFVLAIRAPESDAFKVLLGALLSTGFAAIIAWYFGSSSGSAMKDQAQADVLAKQTDVLAAQSAALATSTPTAPKE